MSDFTSEELKNYYERALIREAESPANQFQNQTAREILRLRAALREVQEGATSKYEDGWCGDIASSALEGAYDSGLQPWEAAAKQRDACEEYVLRRLGEYDGVDKLEVKKLTNFVCMAIQMTDLVVEPPPLPPQPQPKFPLPEGDPKTWGDLGSLGVGHPLRMHSVAKHANDPLPENWRELWMEGDVP